MRDDAGVEQVGPVLEAGEEAHWVVAAIRQLNRDVVVEDHGSYLRVRVAGRCVLTRAAVEAASGRPFRLPGDLEMVMPSFLGRFQVDGEGALWSAEKRR